MKSVATGAVGHCCLIECHGDAVVRLAISAQPLACESISLGQGLILMTARAGGADQLRGDAGIAVGRSFDGVFAMTVGAHRDVLNALLEGLAVNALQELRIHTAVALAAQQRDVSAGYAGFWITSVADVVGAMAGAADGRDRQTGLLENLSVNALGIQLVHVLAMVSVDPCRVRPDGRSGMALTASIRQMDRVYSAFGIGLREYIMRSMTVTAVSGHLVAVVALLGVDTLRILSLFLVMATGALGRLQLVCVGRFLHLFQIDMTDNTILTGLAVNGLGIQLLIHVNRSAIGPGGGLIRVASEAIVVVQ